MSEQTQAAVREALPAIAVKDGLPVIVPGTSPEAVMQAEYAAQRQLIVECATEVMQACEALQDTERKVRGQWWHVLMRLASAVTPGNAKQFSREYDLVRQQILDDLSRRPADAGQFLPSKKAESLAAKWTELQEARSGFSTFANYASQTKLWVEKVAASVDPRQSPESFGMTVRNFYADTKEAEKAAAKRSPKGTTGSKGGTDNAPTVPTGETAEDGTPMVAVVGMSKTNIRAKGPDGKFETIEVNFPAEIIGALTRLHKQIGFAVNEKVPTQRIVEALRVAHDMLGPDAPAKKK